MFDFVRKLVFVFAAALTTATAVSASAPETVEGTTTITVDEAYELFEQGLPFVDVRKASDYDSGRIPGAVNLYVNDAFTQESLAEVVKPDEPVVFYCNGVVCELSSTAAAMAVSWGYSNIYYFREGFPGWDEAGLPIE